jgi:hypothetical protein
MNMSYLTLKHIKVNELPLTWAKQLAGTQTVTVIIITENSDQQPSIDFGMGDKVVNDAYLNDLHSQGIDIKRLRESIQQLQAGEVETVQLEDLDAHIDDFIEKCETLKLTLNAKQDLASWKQTDNL